MQDGQQPYVLSRDEGNAVWFLGTLMTVKATGESTNRGFALIEQVLPPGFAPPPHIHHLEDEAFYLLEGTITFTCGDRTLQASPGSFVYLPRGIAHGFAVTGDQPARLLQINTPTGLEHFFEQVGEKAAAPTLPPPAAPNVEKLLSLAPEYQITIQGPPAHEHDHQ
jgi:quercetin dioxygenase-like cupin family protein